jgi:hypothetical protein
MLINPSLSPLNNMDQKTLKIQKIHSATSGIKSKDKIPLK